MARKHIEDPLIWVWLPNACPPSPLSLYKRTSRYTLFTWGSLGCCRFRRPRQYFFNLQNEAKAFEEAVKRAIEASVCTPDINGTSSTQEVGDKVVEELGKVLKGM